MAVKVIYEEIYQCHALYYGPVQFFFGLKDRLTNLV